MQNFWKLFQQSVIVTSAITLIVVLGIMFMLATNKPVPQELWTIAFAIIGYFFGTKAGNATGLRRQADQANQAELARLKE